MTITSQHMKMMGTVIFIVATSMVLYKMHQDNMLWSHFSFSGVLNLLQLGVGADRLFNNPSIGQEIVKEASKMWSSNYELHRTVRVHAYQRYLDWFYLECPKPNRSALCDIPYNEDDWTKLYPPLPFQNMNLTEENDKEQKDMETNIEDSRNAQTDCQPENLNVVMMDNESLAATMEGDEQEKQQDLLRDKNIHLDLLEDTTPKNTSQDSDL